MSERAFVVLVPAKWLDRAKSRLTSVPVDARRLLAESFLLDTVEALGRTPSVSQVLVVTDDPDVAVRVRRLGAAVIPDGVGGDLNGSLVQAAAESARRWGRLRPVVLCADLPALRAGELEAVLQGVPDGPAVVPDRHGTGTTVYTAETEEFRPAFGPDSYRLHVAAGAATLTATDGLRCDVDEPADLDRARVLGVGPRTARLLDSPDWVGT